MRKFIEKAATLVEALPYIREFRGATVVVKVGGSVMESADNLAGLLTDVAFLSTVGMKVAVVHGGGKAISRAMERGGIAPVFVQGLRVTCDRAIRVVEQVLKREINAEVVRVLQSRGAPARPMHGDWIFRVQRKTGRDAATGAVLDWGFVGEPVEVDVRPVREMLDAGIVPVVTPLGTDADEQLYNVNADTAAAALASTLPARKLAFVSDVPGLLRDPADPSSLIATLRVSEVGLLREAGVVGGGMLPKLESCVEAIRAGVGKVHLVDGRMPHSLLLEVFTRGGVGTEIIADE
jgi:acetylglutamate kinase